MRGQGRIFKRREIWWVSYYHRGKEHRESTKSEQEADARRLLKKRLREIVADTFVGPQQERVSFGELLDSLLRDHELNGRRSIRALKGHMKHLRAAFPLDRAVDITETRIERYKEQRLKEEAAPATVNRELAALRRAFRLAFEQKRVSTVPRVRLLKEENARQGFVETPDFQAIEERLPEYLRDFARFAFVTSWRKGEVRSLLWSDVDLDGRVVRLRPKRSKNSRGRFVALEGELFDLMERRLKDREFKAKDGTTALSSHVFHRRGRKIGEIRKSWNSACQAAGLEGTLFHDLRRSGIRAMVRAGVPTSIAMKISGHLTESVFRRYDITSEEDVRDAVLKTEAYRAQQGKKRKVIAMKKTEEPKRPPAQEGA